jgi:predicted membrane channel-forming protein YqfA (hemolysin III family)
VPGQETKSEKLDRELIELLNELRVALPGVQILFAFLLTVPFAGRFERVTDFQKDTFLFAFLCTMAGSALLMAPTAYHRIQWRRHDKEQMLRISNRLAVAGVVFLALGMTASVLFVTDFLFARAVAVAATAVSGLLFALFWFALPLARRAQD